MSAEHDAVRDLLAPAALGAAAPSEAAMVEEHASRCAVCSEELAGLRAAAAALGTSLPIVEPPPGLKTALMATVREESAARPEPLRPRRRRVPAWLTPRMAWPALTASLAVAALVLFGLNLAARDPAPAQVTTIAVRGTDGAPDLRGQVLLLPDRDVAVVRLERLRPLAADRGYELWAIRDGTPVSAGFLVEEGPGEGILATTDLAGVDSLAVTQEPLTNRASPTGAPVVVVPLPQQV
jgi:hypothetical protein